VVFGFVVARPSGAVWWAYALTIPMAAALAYYLSARKLRALGLKSSTTFTEFIEELRKRWNMRGWVVGGDGFEPPTLSV
jgi:hypothetical protein